jgi:hypothetical protein
MGEREGGMARLKESVTAYRAALEERTSERVPWHFKRTQANLFRSLRMLDDRQGDERDVPVSSRI